LVDFGGWRADRDLIQIDPPQAYGIVQFGRTIKMLEGRGWKRNSVYPHGGNQMSLAIVAGFGLAGCECYPGVFGLFGGFGDNVKVENGLLKLSDEPGIGFEAQNELYAVMRQLAESA
jgi:L-alanine-DL-glutamate epimerase-like enolase superfamily enzyme